MTKITLNDVGDLRNTTTAAALINSNFNTIETAFDNTYSRDGTSPNTLTHTMDANSNRIVNLPNAIANSEPITLGQASILNGGGTIQVTLPTGGTTNQVLKKNSNTNYDVVWSTATGTVTSVALSLPSDFTISGSPVTTSGTLTGTWQTTPTGTGAVVRATSPVLVTPLLGTPTSGTLTNCTGLPLTSVTGIAGAVSTWMGTPTSANLASAVTDETGAGSLVFGTSPVLSAVDARGVWTTGSSWTLPAITLGGTVSGGGNPINNTIIGASLPLAGTFTNLTANTDLTASIHKSATSITFQTNGSTSAGSIASNQKWLLGLATTVGSGPRVAINSNSAASIPNSGVTNDFSLIGSDDNVAGICIQGFSNSFAFATPSITGARTRGTAASPLAVTSGDQLLNIQGVGYFTSGGVGYSTAFASIIIKATETHTSTNQGTKLEVWGTPSGGVATALAMTVQGGVVVGSSGSDPGNGSILASGGIKSSSSSNGIGYTTGSGGTVTQGTNRNTNVTLNTLSGAITLFAQVNAAVSGATATRFTVTNSSVAATDTVVINQKSGTDRYLVYVTAVAAGSFAIEYFSPSGGTTNESPVFQYTVIKGSNT